jgi:flagellar hook assembly protein FlgD
MLPITTMNPILARLASYANSNATGASSAPTASDSSSSSSNQLTGNSFIQLLTAQLQAQDPLNPVDPTTFVTQLVQFNQLEQLIDINQTLSTPPATAAGAGTEAQSRNSQGIASQANQSAAGLWQV